jgi:hypothetical protein
VVDVVRVVQVLYLELRNSVKITCMTTQAASRVMLLLSTAGWRPRQDFKIGPAFTVDPPLVFTIKRPLPAVFLEQIRAISDVTIALGSA